MKRVLVTGASGFVGRHLCQWLDSRGYTVAGTARSPVSVPGLANCDLREIADIGAPMDWGPVLRGVECIVHLAGRAHVMSETAQDPLTEFRRVNCYGSTQLAESAVAAGVKRLIYISTIKVLGEKTESRPFCHTDSASPSDPYAISKLEAEEALSRIAEGQGLELVILRPSLVYGPGVRGNVLRVLGLVLKGMPLPLAAIRNARSMLAVRNFCDVIQTCLEHRDAPGQTFLVSDGEDISTPELFKVIGQSMDQPVRLLPVPEFLLRLGGRLFRRSDEVARLCDSLQVNIEHTNEALDWSPPASLEDSMREMVNWYLGMECREVD